MTTSFARWCILAGLWHLCTPAWAQWPLGKDSPDSVKSGEDGRALTSGGKFQVFTTPQSRGTTFMLDTDTGRMWIMKKDHASGDFSLRRIPVETVDPK
jgi:hypothetical protein